MVVAKSTTTVVATAADVFFKGITVGHVQGPVVINIANTSFDVLVNDFGPNAPVGKFSLGTGATIEVPLAQTDVDVLIQALPFGIAVSGTAVYIGETTGQNLLDQVGTLLVVPKDDGIPQWFFPAAAVSEDFSVPYQLDEQTIINVTFTAFPDPVAPTASGSLARYEPQPS